MFAQAPQPGPPPANNPAVTALAPQPAPAPVAPSSYPPAAPPPQTPPPAAASAGNPTIMLLKEGHSDSVRARAARDLGKEGDPSMIPVLAGALGDPSAKVRREVLLALAQYQQPEVLPPLERGAKDLDSDVRVLAIQCLEGYYTGVLPAPGLTGFMKKNWHRATRGFQPDETHVDPGTAVDPSVVASLVTDLMDTRSNDASREAARGLGILLASSAAPDLAEAAHYSDPDIARQALDSLAKIKNTEVGPKLVDLLDSPNKEVRRDACVTVGILRTQQALPKLESMFQTDPDEKNKQAALEGLAYLGDEKSVPVFLKALASEDKEMRQAAGEGLARAADPKSRADVEKAVAAERDAGARLAMEYALAALGKPGALNDVVSELGGRLRGEVARAYLTELARRPGFLQKLYPYLQSPDTGVRKRLCEVLMHSGDQSSLEPLERLSHDPNGEVAAAGLRAQSGLRARLAASAQATKP